MRPTASNPRDRKAVNRRNRGRRTLIGLFFVWCAHAPQAFACVGDCDASGAVSVNELVMLVRIVVGNTHPSACPNGVPSGSEVDIASIIRAVNNALDRCPFTATATATPTTTPTATASTTPDLAPGSSEFLVARAKSFEVPTKYEPPPGDALSHHTAGFAKTLCSAVFVTGLDPDFAAENVGYFTGPYEERRHVVEKRIDREGKAVHLTLDTGVVRTAKYLGDQGCVALPLGEETVHYTPVQLTSNLPDAATTLWPMGDKLPDEPFPAEIDAAKVAAAANAAFEPAEEMTAAFVVTWKGRIIAEDYGDGIDMHTCLESWSMGKSITSTLMGIMIKQGVYQLDEPAPVPEWQDEGDPRAQIRIQDILRMSSGLRCPAPLDPGLDPSLGYLDHLYLYTGGGNSFTWAATRPQEWPPNTIGRYRNCDPVVINYLVRLGVEARGEEYLSFPQRALFDKIGIRNMVVEADPYGNFLLQGYELGSGRDWARLGNLYLQDGVWNGERILPAGYAKFVSTVAPAWAADGRPVYGGFFWINMNQTLPIPTEAYYMQGAGGQYTIIIPSHDLVVVRLGHFKGAWAAEGSLRRALALLMEAVPRS